MYDLDSTIEYYQQQYYSTLPLELATDDVQQNLALHADNNTLLSICQTSSHMRKICHSKRFWQERYKVFNLPIPDYVSHDLNINIKTFEHAYHSMSMVNFYLNSPMISKEGISYERPNTVKYMIDFFDNHSIIYKDLDYDNLEHMARGRIKMTVTIKKINNHYTLSLTDAYQYYTSVYQKSHYKDIATLTEEQMIMFLYGLLNNKLFIGVFMDPRFGPRTLWRFEKQWYDVYEKFYNIKFKTDSLLIK